MELKKLAEPFREDQIEWRIAQAGTTPDGRIWAQCLAYIDARAMMDRLDEVVGPLNWKVSYRFEVTGNHPGVVCALSVRNVITNDWVTKEDGAEQTEIESFKGGISSALKRAGAAWGIGRYLYSLETGFAEIVEKGADGAKYGKSKDVNQGRPFYWKPPRLPAWALPGASQSGATKGEFVFPAPAKIPTPQTEKEKESEKEFTSKVNNILQNQAAAWKVPFGKYIGKPLGQVPGQDAKEYADFLERESLKSGKPLSENAAKFCKYVKVLLEKDGVQKPVAAPPQTEEFPFEETSFGPM